MISFENSRQKTSDEAVKRFRGKYAKAVSPAEKDIVFKEFTSWIDFIANGVSRGGPEFAYKVIARQAGISNNSVQSNLLRNWLLLTTPHQDVYKPSPQEVDAIKPSFSLKDAEAFKKDLETKHFTDESQQFTGHYDILGAAFAPGTIGHFITHIDATTEYINTSAGRWYKATGTFSILDPYDFDVQDEAVRRAFDSLMRGEPITDQKFQGRSNVANSRHTL